MPAPAQFYGPQRTQGADAGAEPHAPSGLSAGCAGLTAEPG
jgi:hypothetical protein